MIPNKRSKLNWAWQDHWKEIMDKTLLTHLIKIMPISGIKLLVIWQGKILFCSKVVHLIRDILILQCIKRRRINISNKDVMTKIMSENKCKVYMKRIRKYILWRKQILSRVLFRLRWIMTNTNVMQVEWMNFKKAHKS